MPNRLALPLQIMGNVAQTTPLTTQKHTNGMLACKSSSQKPENNLEHRVECTVEIIES